MPRGVHLLLSFMARLDGEAALLHVVKDAAHVAAVTRAAAAAVYDHLRREDDLRVGRLPGDLDAVLQ